MGKIILKPKSRGTITLKKKPAKKAFKRVKKHFVDNPKNTRNA